MRDDLEFNILFCELIEKYPVLYDHSRSDYCNRNVQDKLWHEIGKRLNVTAKDCKDRWTNIRGRYSKMKKARSLPSGSGAKAIKEYYLAPYLNFLDDFIKSRKPKSSLNRDELDLNNSDFEPETTFSPATQSSAEFDSRAFSMPSPSPTASVRTRTPTLKEVNKTAYQYFTQKKNLEKPTSIQDSDLSFLQSVLPDMKLMTPDQKRTFKIGILNLAGQILKENSPVDHQSLTSFTSHNLASGYQNPGSSTQAAQLIQRQPASSLVNPSTSTQHQAQYASPAAEYQNPAQTIHNLASAYQNPGSSTQAAQLIQRQPASSLVNPSTSTQHQAQYASPAAEYQNPAQTIHNLASAYQNPGSSTQAAQLIQRQPASSLVNPSTSTQHQAQYASPAAEYQNPAQTYHSLSPYSSISTASVNSRLPFNDRTTELSPDDDY